MAEFPQIQAPSFKLSDESKERLRKVDTVRPYAHRAAIFGLPAMASANYMLPQMKRRGLAVGAIGAAGAGLGLMDRKIEQLAEEHEELRPTLKNYSKGTPSSGISMSAKTASVSDRVRRNQDELAAAFPMTMAQRVELQKEALLLDPKTTAKATGQALSFMRGAKPTLIGAGVGAVGGAAADGENRGRGALTGALVGGALGGGATALTRAYTPELRAGMTAANRAAIRGGKPVGAADYTKTFKEGFKNYKPPVAPEGTASTAAVQKQTRRSRKATSPVQQPVTQPAVQSTPTQTAQELGDMRTREKTQSAPASSLRHRLHQMTSKEAGINTMHDAHRAIGGRPPYALLTMGGETSNDAVINQMLRALFANTDAMRKATEDQVLAAFPLSAPYSYGRHRAIGRTADDIKAEIALAYTPTQR